MKIFHGFWRYVKYFGSLNLSKDKKRQAVLQLWSGFFLNRLRFWDQVPCPNFFPCLSLRGTCCWKWVSSRSVGGAFADCLAALNLAYYLIECYKEVRSTLEKPRLGVRSTQALVEIYNIPFTLSPSLMLLFLQSFFNCTQNDITSQHLSLSLGLEKPRLMLLIF